MSFLTITDGVHAALTLDVSMTGAQEKEPDRTGGAARSFSGKWRSDEQEFRLWDFTFPLLTQANFLALRTMVKGGAPVSVTGDAIEGVPTSAIIRINSAAFVDDDRPGSGGFSRDVSITVMAGVPG